MRLFLPAICHSWEQWSREGREVLGSQQARAEGGPRGGLAAGRSVSHPLPPRVSALLHSSGPLKSTSLLYLCVCYVRYTNR